MALKPIQQINNIMLPYPTDKPESSLIVAEQAPDPQITANNIRRFEINRKALEILREDTLSYVRSSRFFKYKTGGQSFNYRFKWLFKEGIVFMRGKEPLARKGAYKIARSVRRSNNNSADTWRRYSDVYWRGRASEGGAVIRSTYTVKKILEAIIDENYGLFIDFFALLKKANREIESWIVTRGDVNSRIDWDRKRLSDLIIGPLLGVTLGIPLLFFNKCGDDLKEIYSRLLAVKWLEKDQQRLAEELQVEFVPEQFSILLPQGHFDFEGTRYVVYPTCANGACALEALLGENVDGEFRYRGNVREYFADALTKKRNDPHVQKLFLNILRSYHNDKKTDPSSKMLFSNVTGSWLDKYEFIKNQASKQLDDLNKKEVYLWVKELEKSAFKKKFLEIRRKDQLREGNTPETPEQVLAEIRRKPWSVLDTIHGDEHQFISLLDGIEKREIVAEIVALSNAKKNINDRETKERDKILLSDKAFNHYVQVVQQDTFWFNTQEIELASYLFDKKTLLFYQKGREIKKQLFNPDLEGETTYIFHLPNHFCRTSPSKYETTVLDLKLAYARAQKEAEAYLGNDRIAEKLLDNTIKDEICQLGFSAGLTLLTANPAPIVSQAVMSVSKIAITSLDPFRKNQISSWAETAVLPTFQLVSGEQLKSVVVPLVANQSIRKLYDWDEKKNGGKIPEWMKRCTIAPFAVLGAKNPEEKYALGVFGAVIKGGMDGALHKWEKYKGIDKEYWENNPSWGNRIVKTAFTKDDIQNAMAKRFVKAISPPPEVNKSTKKVINRVKKFINRNREVERQLEINPQDPSIIQPKPQPPENIDLTYSIEKKSDNYIVKRCRNGFSTITCGEFSVQAEAESWQRALESEIERVNRHNKMIYGLAFKLYELNVPLDPLGIKYREPTYAAISATGNKVKLYIGDQKASEVKNKKGASKVIRCEAKQQIDININDGKEVFDKLKEAVETQAPPHITIPQGVHETPRIRYGKEHIYVSGVDEFGQTTLLCKFKNKDADDARLLATDKARLEADIFDLESQCSQARIQLAKNGVPITDIPKEPQFERPNITGKIYEKIQPQIRASEIRNQQTAKQYIAKLSADFNQTFDITKMTPSGKDQLVKSLVPEVKPMTKSPYSPDHGFFYNLRRGNGKEWLDDNGIEVSCEISYTTPFYTAPKSSGSSYHETQMDLAYQKSTLDYAEPNDVTQNNPQPTVQTESSSMPMSVENPTTNPSWTWADYQSYAHNQIMQTIETNIANCPSPSARQPLDLTNPIQAIESAHENICHQNFFGRRIEPLNVKTYPKGNHETSNIPIWLRGFAGPDHLSYDPQERIEMNDQLLVATVHSVGKFLKQATDEPSSVGSVNAIVREGKITSQSDKTVSGKIADFVSEHSHTVSAVLDCIPVVSTSKSMQELFSGYDPITGEKVGRLESGFSIVVDVLSVHPVGKLLPAGGKLAAKGLKNIGKGGKLAKRTARAAKRVFKPSAKAEAGLAKKHIQTIIKEKQLPVSGTKPFKPKKTKSGGLKKDRHGGYIDKQGNSWRRDSRKKEWDVQHRSGRHTNVNSQGEITHGKDNF